MKNTLELKELGLVELNSTEQKEISGGLFGLLAAIFAIISAVAALIDYAQGQSSASSAPSGSPYSCI